jgi:DNA-binding MarR family transcriptional regulator
LPHTLVFHLIDLGKKLQKAGFSTSPKQLSYSQKIALLVIDSFKQMSQAEIAAKLHLKPASIVTLIDELERLKLVKRKIKASNRRQHEITLTRSGKIQAQKIKKQARSIEKFVKNQLNAQEADKLYATVTKLIQSLDNQPQNNSKRTIKKGGDK